MNRSPRRATCKPVTRVAFLKVHKAGSSTVASLFQRFGFTRNLNFVIPRKRLHAFGYNYFGEFGDSLSSSNVLPAPDGQSYDVLWNHVVYNHTSFRSILPNDTVYVSILREPFDQFVSAFDYFGMYTPNYVQKVLRFDKSNPISDYLKNPTKYEPANTVMSRVRNKQSYDLGMTRKEILDPTLRSLYITQLDDDFRLVMIMEHFDESIILLRRKLCWNHKDVLYFRKNVNPYRRRRFFFSSDYKRHRHMSQSDYDMYDYFHKVFWDAIWREGPEFFDEVRYFKKLLKKTLDYCLSGRKLHVPRTKWSDAFDIAKEDCNLLSLTELQFLDRIVQYTAEKLYKQYMAKMSNSTTIMEDFALKTKVT